jgi:hypothetical protein
VVDKKWNLFSKYHLRVPCYLAIVNCLVATHLISMLESMLDTCTSNTQDELVVSDKVVIPKLQLFEDKLQKLSYARQLATHYDRYTDMQFVYIHTIVHIDILPP